MREGLMEEFYQTTAGNRERKEEQLALKDKDEEMRDYYRSEEDQWSREERAGPKSPLY